MKQLWCAWMMVCACAVTAATAADSYNIKVDVTQHGNVFHTQASFYLPLSVCQSYRYLTRMALRARRRWHVVQVPHRV